MKNLYMTTTQFAALVVNCLDEQNYFKRDVLAHPSDIANAFSTVGETIGSAMDWAIMTSNEQHKRGMMEATTLKKNLE